MENENQNEINWYKGQNVIIRGYASGCKIGKVKFYDPITRHCNLLDSRRIFYWDGAFTLHEVAMKGISKESKLTITHPEILITDVCEIIPVSDEAMMIFNSIPSHEINELVKRL